MPTPRSEGASAKAARHRTDDELPVHSLHTLLQDLATLTYNITSTRSIHRPRSSSRPVPHRCRAKPLRCSASTPAVPSSRPLPFENLSTLQQVSSGVESNLGLKFGLAEGEIRRTQLQAQKALLERVIAVSNDRAQRLSADLSIARAQESEVSQRQQQMQMESAALQNDKSVAERKLLMLQRQVQQLQDQSEAGLVQ